MRINAIDSNYDKNNIKPSFNRLIKDRSALPIIKSMSENDFLEFEKIEKKLNKTKLWDLKISSIGNAFKEFKFHFINKKDNNNIITDGIYPYNKQDNTIRFYSIIYGPENTSKNRLDLLTFKTKERADELFNQYQENILYMINRNYNITPLESLKLKETELNMLEEASEITEKNSKKIHLNTEIETKKTIGNGLPITKL